MFQRKGQADSREKEWRNNRKCCGAEGDDHFFVMFKFFLELTLSLKFDFEIMSKSFEILKCWHGRNFTQLCDITWTMMGSTHDECFFSLSLARVFFVGIESMCFRSFIRTAHLALFCWIVFTQKNSYYTLDLFGCNIRHLLYSRHFSWNNVDTNLVSLSHNSTESHSHSFQQVNNDRLMPNNNT